MKFIKIKNDPKSGKSWRKLNRTNYYYKMKNLIWSVELSWWLLSHFWWDKYYLYWFVFSHGKPSIIYVFEEQFKNCIDIYNLFISIFSRSWKWRNNKYRKIEPYFSKTMKKVKNMKLNWLNDIHCNLWQ